MTIAGAVLLWTPAFASTVLTGGSGTFTFPAATGPVGASPGISPTLVNGSGNFTGTWPASTGGWAGTFTATGPLSSTGSGTVNSYTFTTLAAGYLPSDTYLRLSDLDSGEQWTLSAYDAGGSLITSHWMTDAVFVSGNSAEFVQQYMPNWAFSGGVYTLTGETGPGNPTLLYVVQSAQNIGRIDINRIGDSNSFSLSAPVPEPASVALTGVGLAAVGLARRRRRNA
ncbi:MAG: PEP-CTERM sorting domain-containing protein [Bryobacteraceae bacterium]